ncbi:hypothetical protein [Allonocardiopsis opalescens]|uniref:Membrane protein YgcG n=1 Tax=Allonocardiopsis opalescens TaxID=1144618 RepID=A0A2T0PSE0_9ACTN|nr:hypothetical protein [Allonocardiopsis opalescens]PRX91817.1 hypothetical protein CLV72_1132 [Allonocardiopsis opalescens]
MWRIAAVLGTLTAGLVAPPAAAAEVERAWVDQLAEELAADPVHVSDHLLGHIPAAGERRIAAAVAGLDFPVYVAVVPTASSRPAGTDGLDGEELAAALHGRIGADGVYVVTDARGIGLTARAYGAPPEAETAALAAWYGAEDGESAVELLEDFAEIAASGQAEQRLEQAREAAEAPEPWTERAGLDRPENQAFLAGTAIGAAATVALVLAARIAYRARSRRAAERHS